MADLTTQLLVQARTGDKKARDTLVEDNLGLVHYIVKRFLNRGYEAEDLFQIGCIGLMKAIDQFDISYQLLAFLLLYPFSYQLFPYLQR